MNRSDELPILIIGGGIGGISAALALAKKGLRVHVLEQAPEFKEVGAGIQMGPNAFKMFDRLGIVDAINESAVFPENLILMDAISGHEVTRIPLDATFRARFGYPYGLIHRADLLDVLIKAARGIDLIALETSKNVVKLEQTDPFVTVTTEDGHSYRGAAVIGADGIWSPTRAQILGDGEPRVTGHIAYRAVLPIEEVPEPYRSDERANSVVLWAGPQVHLAHYKIRRGELWNMGAIFHSRRWEQGANSFGDPSELHERFQGLCPAVTALLGKIEEWRMWVLRDRDPVENWSSGRVTLLGDAAHPTLQYMAQGAIMAIEDAVTLADLIEANDSYEACFRAYQDRRALRTGRVTLTSRFYGELYHAEGINRRLRNEVLSSLTPQRVYDSVAWLYNGV